MNQQLWETRMIELRTNRLADLPKTIGRPGYDRSALTAGIVHIGVGNFHRAHQAWYLHRLFEKGMNTDWAIVGAGVRPYDEDQRRKLAAQDYLTTLIELDPSGSSAEVIGPMIDYVPVSPDNGPLIERMARPGMEVILGCTRDPKFGPIVMFGLGGTLVEAIKDVTFRLAPMRVASAENMIRSIKTFNVLEGIRGNPPSDLAAIRDCILRVSTLVADHPEISELDINPLIVYPDGRGAVVADCRVMLKAVDA